MSTEPLKIGLLSDFTIRGLREELTLRCAERGIAAHIYEGGYNQFHQEFLDEKSGLRQFYPDITFFLRSNKSVLPDAEVQSLASGAERTRYLKSRIDESIETIHSFLKNISGIIVVSNLVPHTYSPLGINEDKTACSFTDWPGEFNRQIKAAFIKERRVRIFDMSGFFARFGEEALADDKLRYLGDMQISPSSLPWLAEELMAYIKAFSARNRKCIVLDLDNTLWGGIVGEDGFDRIKLGLEAPGNAFVEFQRHLLALQKRGVILAINSRNNAADALEVIRKHPHMVLREEHFASIQTNWESKVDNMLRIAAELNIGLDSCVFIDDERLNRELIKEHLPEVLVVDLPEDASLYAKTVKRLTDFNTVQLTEEDFQKGKMYYEQGQRNILKRQAPSIDSFLAGLKTKMTIAKATDFTLPRIAQLMLKTNQFNLTTQRYTEADIAELSHAPGVHVFSVTVTDTFGDAGLVGVLILKQAQDEMIIDSFLLSCRMLGRHIENALLYFAAVFAQKCGVVRIVGEYIPTKKNAVCADFYGQSGFESVDGQRFELKEFAKIRAVPHIVINE